MSALVDVVVAKTLLWLPSARRIWGDVVGGTGSTFADVNQRCKAHYSHCTCGIGTRDMIMLSVEPSCSFTLKAIDESTTKTARAQHPAGRLSISLDPKATIVDVM